MQDLLIALGLILFLLGLLTGLAVPALRNPRMALASHMQGMTNGPFLVVLGLAWPRLNLSHSWEIVTVVLVVYGTYANWLATQLGAWWGAGHRFAPAASGSYRASPAKERAGLAVAHTRTGHDRRHPAPRHRHPAMIDQHERSG